MTRAKGERPLGPEPEGSRGYHKSNEYYLFIDCLQDLTPLIIINMKKLGIYIHIPFCRSKCAYCDFYSIVSSEHKIEQYLKALNKELAFYSSIYKKKYTIDTVYIGGGTPSILAPEQIEFLIENIKKTFVIIPKPEISIEVNPESLSEAHLKIFQKCGINRLSIGVQTFNNKILKTIKRRTDKAEIIKKIKLAGKYFKKISLDLIIGLPYQDEALFKKDLENAVSFKPVHLSLYSLMLKKDLPLFQVYKEKKDIFLDDDQTADCYIYADKFLSAHKLKRYEISNFVNKGYECIHNLKYWLLQPYLGLGASAASFMDGRRWKNIDDVDKYIKHTVTGKFKEREFENINKIKHYNEKIMLSLRLKDGIDIKGLSRKEAEFLQQKEKEISNFKKMNYLKEKGGRLYLTVKGVMVSNSIISELLM